MRWTDEPRTARRTVRLRGTAPSLAALRDRGVFGPERIAHAAAARGVELPPRRRPARQRRRPRPQPVEREREIAAPERRGAAPSTISPVRATPWRTKSTSSAVDVAAEARPLAWRPREQLDEPLAHAVEERAAGRPARRARVPIASQKPRSAICVARDQLRRARGTPPPGRRARARRRRPRRAARPGGRAAPRRRSSLVGKRRKIVAVPTPARSAISVTRRVEPVLGEHLARRLEHPREVALRVGAEHAWCRRRHAAGTRLPRRRRSSATSRRAHRRARPRRCRPAISAAPTANASVEAARQRRARLRRARCDEMRRAATSRASRASRARARRRPAATC